MNWPINQPFAADSAEPDISNGNPDAPVTETLTERETAHTGSANLLVNGL